MKSLLLTLLILISFQAHSQNLSLKEISGTIKEAFVEGSIDGKSLFLVYGLADGLDESGYQFKKAAVNLSDYSKDLKRLVVDKESKTSLIGALATKNKQGKRIAPNFLEDVSKSSKSFKQEIEFGRDALHNSKTTLGGSVKFAGRAVWGTFKGAYYLIIQAPARAVYNISATALTVPIRLVGTGLRFAWSTSIASAKLAYHTLAGTSVGAYSLASSTIASGVIITVAGVLAVGKGLKFVFYRLPRKVKFPLFVQGRTELDFNDIQSLSNTLKSDLELSFNEVTFEVEKVEKYSAKIIGKDQNSKVVIIGKIKTQAKNLNISLEASNSLIKSRRELSQNLRKDEKQNIEEIFTQIIEKL